MDHWLKAAAAERRSLARVQHLAQTAGFYSSKSSQQLILLISCCTQAEDWNQLLSPLIGEKSCRLLALRKADPTLTVQFCCRCSGSFCLIFGFKFKSQLCTNAKPQAWSSTSSTTTTPRASLWLLLTPFSPVWPQLWLEVSRHLCLPQALPPALTSSDKHYFL